VVVVVSQVLKLLADIGPLNGVKHVGGIAVESLAGSVGESGLSRHRAVGSVEDSGGVGDAKLGR
jgi:hypothetical protein